MKFQKPRGTKDILPKDINHWIYVENTIRGVTKLYNFSEIRTPTFESTELFAKGVGNDTDIVGKEMYTFLDKGGNSITLKPEMTASVVRAYLENSLSAESQIQKLYYISSMFRYEKPQQGRYREHTQFGAEILGSDTIESDIEIILLAKEIYNRSGIKNFTIKINSIGKAEERKNYITVLKEFLKKNIDSLSEDSKRRFDTNPLRILDSKNDKDMQLTNNAPKILDHLTDQSRSRFEGVIESLKYLGIETEIDFRLVRGLDYYTDTTFEFISKDLGSQDAIGGGGRYDGLIEMLGGKPTPGVGFASGLERLIFVAEKNNFNFPEQEKIKVYFINLTSGAKKISSKLINALRENGISCEQDFLNRSIKAQMREANKLNSEFVYIIGDEELMKGTGMLKKMSDGSQNEIAFDDLLNSMKIN
jgi:histidyl-tRNA synthetase